MTNQGAWTLYEQYLEGWKAITAVERTSIVENVVAADVQYFTRNHESGDRLTIIEDMAAFQAKFPGGRFDIGDVSSHHDVALLTWVLVQADGSIFAKGHDQMRVSAEGKIISLITFPPSAPKS